MGAREHSRCATTPEAPTKAFGPAIDLYGGELLTEDRYEPWAVARREAVAEARLGLLVDYAQRLAEAGEMAGAVEALQQAVVADPLHEGAHRALMRLFVRVGRRQRALAQYQRLRDALRGELEADPDPQTVDLCRVILHGQGPVEAAHEPSPPAFTR